jgi:hypothetical protein
MLSILNSFDGIFDDLISCGLQLIDGKELYLFKDRVYLDNRLLTQEELIPILIELSNQ